MGNLAYDETDDSIIFIAATGGASVGFRVKFSPEEGIIWVTARSTGAPIRSRARPG